MRYTFTKEERLSSKCHIEQLFKKGKIVNEPPFRALWQEAQLNSAFPVQVVISVPRKTFKKAADRNILKRRIREAYRKNKHVLYKVLDTENKQLALMFIYNAATILNYKEINHKIILILQRLGSYYEKDSK